MGPSAFGGKALKDGSITLHSFECMQVSSGLHACEWVHVSVKQAGLILLLERERTVEEGSHTRIKSVQLDKCNHHSSWRISSYVSGQAPLWTCDSFKRTQRSPKMMDKDTSFSIYLFVWIWMDTGSVFIYMIREFSLRTLISRDDRSTSLIQGIFFFPLRFPFVMFDPPTSYRGLPGHT